VPALLCPAGGGIGVWCSLSLPLLCHPHYAKLDASLVSLGFIRNPLEHAVYRRGDNSSYLLIGVYVDDLIITGTEVSAIVEFKQQM
jgi:hypothetical protein